MSRRTGELLRVRRILEAVAEGEPVPAWQILPEAELQGGAVFFHAYGSRKESLLGLGLKLAERGFACLLPDLPGHGDHPRPLSPAILEEARAWVRVAGRYGRVVAVGHSLGGRLALLSGASAVVALSPALPQQPSPEGMYALATFPTPRVRQERPGYVVEVMRSFPDPHLSSTPVLLVVGKGDIPGIVAAAQELASSLPEARLVEVEEGLLGEIPEPPAGFLRYLRHWLNHAEVAMAGETGEAILPFVKGVLRQEP